MSKRSKKVSLFKSFFDFFKTKDNTDIIALKTDDNVSVFYLDVKLSDLVYYSSVIFKYHGGIGSVNCSVAVYVSDV